MITTLYRKANPKLEIAYHVQSAGSLSNDQLQKLRWLVAEAYEPQHTGFIRHFSTKDVVCIGPRLSIETPFSSNAVAMCHAMGLTQVSRVEQMRRYLIGQGQSAANLLKTHLDRMTEQHYTTEIETFDSGIVPAPVRVIDLIGRGRVALEEANKVLGLGMDNADIDYYYPLFVEVLKRNPTDVELFQIGNANSEHSRHWYFNGRIIIDGAVMDRTLMQVVKEPLQRLGQSNRTLKAFNDNGGVLCGFEVPMLLPCVAGQPSALTVQKAIVHITATAETHNHPTYIAPFPGAATGAGGEMRDDCAIGKGAMTGVGAAGYFVGNLFIPNYPIPGEVVGRDKPSQYASPLKILVDGSNGISNYGNSYGRPLTLGFCRTFGQIVDGDWREPRKPVLYSAGSGHVFDEHLYKEKPEVGMLLVHLGGPTHPVGMGGGSASSMAPGQNSEELDYNSVQRGNPEMEKRANNAIRACAELGPANPISSIHDKGAGGLSNVLTELMEPAGGTVDIREVDLGDKTMSVLQIWSAESQEGYGLLIRPQNIELFKSICERERVTCKVLGKITGSGNVVVTDSLTSETHVDLNLKQILTEMPQKTFESTRKAVVLPPLVLPKVSIAEAVQAVFQLPSVGSKGHLVHKVDRSVTGLVAQQQCCGIEQVAVADYSINAQSHFGLSGAVQAIGEQPIKMLINASAGARMAVGEMLTNMASARVSSIADIRCRLNVMAPAKMAHQGPVLWDAEVAACALAIDLGIAAPDGGKDSLSMAAKVAGEKELVKAPGELVVFGTAPVPDITKKLTPDIKQAGKSNLYAVDLGLGKNRLGGSALAQAFNQTGNESPDVDDPSMLRDTFVAMQQQIDDGGVLASHDRSDGGLIASVAEMCMASRCGFTLYVDSAETALAQLFTEELGLVLEVLSEDEARVLEICNRFNIPCSLIGVTRDDTLCGVVALSNDATLFSGDIKQLRAWWEQTSYEIEKLQMNPDCAEEEYRGLKAALPSAGQAPSYRLSFTPEATFPYLLSATNKLRVAVIREEGTNGDREMQAALFAAGFEPWDVTMSDLLAGRANLASFRGVVFAGGFSFMDVFGSAKGWAGSILFNDRLREMFDQFYARPDTFSLGVCNGCQLMALLGWVPWRGIGSEEQPRFIGNKSGEGVPRGRFDSRWVQVEILPSPAIMFSGMAGSRLGVYIAHGEGRLFYPSLSIQKMVEEQHLAPLSYLDPHGNRTETYPYNPNGSPGGITALCSPDGRHLAMMPHPERCFRLWQWGWVPPSWRSRPAAPWLRVFQNARIWSEEHGG